ncbi:Coiled-coil domain containing protein 88B [Dissostichus eleginoides]|uniref:Coiled-coil domain containing protein 88B n=1 Tax=Dissostichus eleginoides TaxID=100907 RepID=A0AAD9BBM0_DISEL|nr:Coiled-coil domain containing protein 88B [Dissostichus eleginoides]
MPEPKGKSTKTLKDEDIKSIAEVVRTLLHEELDASLDRVANKIDAMQSELATLTTRITSAEGELDALKNSTKKDSTQLKPEIERAHRIFRGSPPTEGERPRAFIFCCLRFSTRQAILHQNGLLHSSLRFTRGCGAVFGKRPSPGRLVDVAPAELGEEQAAPMTISPDHSDPHVGNE